MNILLLEDSKLNVTSFMEDMYQLFPYSSRLSISKRNYQDILKTLKTSPLLTKVWLVNVRYKGLSEDQLKYISSVSNVNVFNVKSKIDLEEISSIFKTLGLQYNVVNNLELPKDKIIEYVQKSLNISYEDSKYICGRHRYYLQSIVNSVAILSTFDKIDRKIIKDYTKRFDSVSLYSLTSFILGINGKHSYSRIVELVYNYRYAMDFLIGFLKTEVNKYNVVFKYIDEGLLLQENIKDFKEEFKQDKVIASISEQGLKWMIEDRAKLSLEKLYFVMISLEGLNTSRHSVYKLLNLLKTGG